ncbi:FAD-dependent oxidoreductase [Streptomyces chrestomyceticus]|uniref:NAD(P)-binding domain-containing protein n=1 Tax=Streptomyces chrestomyceticus TaxID=68185 RepID=A0ABU7WT32_9ACTN
MTRPGSAVGQHDVAVIGCGLMGAALARTFAKNGYAVAVWNRTPGRAEALSGDRITPARSIGDAVRSSRLIVACTSTTEALLTALAPAAPWHGAALVNLASSSPEEAEGAERWAAARGAAYLDGAVLCRPQDIGSSRAAILYAGSSAVWSEHERTLKCLAGASTYVSEQVTAASLLNVGLVGAFYVSALSAYVEAATYVLSQGVSVEALHALTPVAVAGLEKAAEEAAAAIASGEHATDQATIDTYAEGAGAALAVLRGSGQRARLLAAAAGNLATAAAAGLGAFGFSAQTEVMNEGGTATAATATEKE